MQTLLFDKDLFSLADAKAWARRHNWTSSDVDEKGNFIHLRQEDPSHFDRIRTIPFHRRGVEARVGWPSC